MLDWTTKVTFSSLLHLANDESSDLRRRVVLATSLKPRITIGVLDNLESVKILSDSFG